jgi:hypothetical protein
MAGVPSEKSATRKDDPDALTCTDFGPESKSINIAGRPVQLLIVTHAGAPAREWDSYYNFCLWPLKPIMPPAREWFGYNCEHSVKLKKCRKQSPQTGAQGSMITAKGVVGSS